MQVTFRREEWPAPQARGGKGPEVWPSPSAHRPREVFSCEWHSQSHLKKNQPRPPFKQRRNNTTDPIRTSTAEKKI